MQRSKISFYSITSSATSSRSRGISRSRYLAVLRLMTSLVFGRLLDGQVEGFSPLSQAEPRELPQRFVCAQGRKDSWRAE